MSKEHAHKAGTPDAAIAGLPRRRSLDGLRAIAILGVLLYHGGGSWATGGFLGVDLFFVISGFLITSLLVNEHHRSGRVNLRAFWGARARRLLPALGAVLITVLWIMPALGVRWSERAGNDAWASAFFVSNWRFISSGESYVDQATRPSPLLHTWSLAIEEQWYLVLPIVVLIVMRTSMRDLFLTTFLTIGAIASIVMCAVLYVPGAVDRAYLGTDTRVQALLIGALTAILFGGSAWRGGKEARVLIYLAFPAFVVLMVIMAIATPESAWMFHGGFALVAVTSAVLIVGIIADDTQERTLTHILCLKPVVGLGVISYGVYLWHWPIFVALDNTRVGLDGYPLFGVRLAVTFVVAIASYYLIEQPVRRRVWRRWNLPKWPAPIAVVAGAAVVFSALFFPAAAAPEAPDSLTALKKAADQARKHPTKPTASPVAGARRVVLVGDSQAVSLFAAVKDHPGDNYAVLIASRIGCGVAPFTAAAAGVVLRPKQPLCGDWDRLRAAEIGEAQADTGVLFGGTWEQYDRSVDGRTVRYDSPEWMTLTTAAYVSVLTEMSQSVQHLAIALDHCHKAPKLDLPVSTLFQSGRYPPVVNDTKRIAAVNQALKAAAATFPDVTVLDVNDYLCPSGYTAKLDGVTLRTDGVHWTSKGGQLVWRWMRPQL